MMTTNAYLLQEEAEPDSVEDLFAENQLNVAWRLWFSGNTTGLGTL